MTIQELITKLSAFPPDTPVLVEAYEDGYNDSTDVQPLRVKPHAQSQHDWNGNYEEADEAEGDSVVLIAGKWR